MTATASENMAHVAIGRSQNTSLSALVVVPGLTDDAWETCSASTSYPSTKWAIQMERA